MSDLEDVGAEAASTAESANFVSNKDLDNQLNEIIVNENNEMTYSNEDANASNAGSDGQINDRLSAVSVNVQECPDEGSAELIVLHPDHVNANLRIYLLA